MKNSNQILILFETCRIVKGHNKILVLDIQRSLTFDLPNSALEMLNLFEQNTGSEIFVSFKDNKQELEIIEEYYCFFLKNELCFLCDKEERDFFPKLNTSFYSPSIITNYYLEFEDFKITNDYTERIVRLFNKCKVSAVLINYNYIEKEAIKTLIKSINDLTSITHIDLILRHSPLNYKVDINEYFSCSFKITNIYLYSKQKDKIEDSTTHNILQTTKSYDELFADRNNVVFFIPVLDYKLSNYLESQESNLFYNQRIFINNDYIVTSQFKREKVISLKQFEDDINSSDFARVNEFWKIHKEKVLVCNECEYRRICLDERIPIKMNKTEMWYYSSECSYNPFISKWNHEEGYTTLKECGIHIKKDSFKINQSKLTEIKSEIWGD
jgi:hypothetical protein